ncbi:hypothetical protein [Variovorax paradoxus]|uniref:hypothetical protein n=1 Tax=Variovorax paradoxus TaxID=34073 RepID=UPI001ABC76B7
MKRYFHSKLDAALQLLEALIGFGLVSGAAVAAALGQFILGGILGALAIGVFLRFKRGRVRK